MRASTKITLDMVQNQTHDGMLCLLTYTQVLLGMAMQICALLVDSYQPSMSRLV